MTCAMWTMLPDGHSTLHHSFAYCLSTPHTAVAKSCHTCSYPSVHSHRYYITAYCLHTLYISNGDWDQRTVCTLGVFTASIIAIHSWGDVIDFLSGLCFANRNEAAIIGTSKSNRQKRERLVYHSSKLLLYSIPNL